VTYSRRGASRDSVVLQESVKSKNQNRHRNRVQLLQLLPPRLEHHAPAFCAVPTARTLEHRAPSFGHALPVDRVWADDDVRGSDWGCGAGCDGGYHWW
jgi:hypothetical protein